MKFLIALLYLTIFIPFNINAQIATASIFSDMKSLNPAVISKRKTGEVSLSGAWTKLDRTMKIETSTYQPTGANITTDVMVEDLSFFRGGKGGGFFTTELTASLCNGDRKDHLTYADDDIPREIRSKAQSGYFNGALSLGNFFGLGLTHVTYKHKIAYEQSYNGTNYANIFNVDLEYIGIRPGLVLGMKNWSIGAYYEYISISGKLESSYVRNGVTDNSSSQSGYPNSQIIGGAFALTLGKIQLEVSHEMMPFEEKQNAANEEVKVNSRTSALAEVKLGQNLAVGYKANYYQNSFTDLDRIIHSRLLYGAMNGSTRLDHIVNFEFSRSHGLSVGGFFSMSNYKSKELTDLVYSTEKHATETKTMSASFKLGYAF